MRASSLARLPEGVPSLVLGAMLLGAVACSARAEEEPGVEPLPAPVVPVLDLGLAGGADSTSFEACATAMAESAPLPPALQLVVDTSGSMSWPPGWTPQSGEEPPEGLPSKWEVTRAELLRVVEALPSATTVGMNFFPNVAHAGRSCIKNEVALPVQALGESASSQRRSFAEALTAVDPQGGTPTHAAYRFGVERLTGQRLFGNGFVLLITDGAPTYTHTCAGDGASAVDSAPLVAEAARALAEHGTRTFVIGSPGSEPGRAALSRVARAGGTGDARCSDQGPNFCHFDMTGPGDLGKALERALSEIATRVTSCEYAIPKAPQGESLDRERVNVIWTAPDGSLQMVPRASDSACENGWTYSADVRKIVLCAETCKAVQNDPASRVDVVFGCASRYSAPR